MFKAEIQVYAPWICISRGARGWQTSRAVDNSARTRAPSQLNAGSRGTSGVLSREYASPAGQRLLAERCGSRLVPRLRSSGAAEYVPYSERSDPYPASASATPVSNWPSLDTAATQMYENNHLNSPLGSKFEYINLI